MVGVQLSMGMIIISWFIGFLIYYLISSSPKKDTKVHIEELISQFINFILLMWIGKIILNFSSFIKAPLVILAYPSNSAAFYFAILLITINIVYKAKRKDLEVLGLVDAFIYVFLSASFVYEFIQIVFNNNTYSFGYFILLAVLFMFFLFIRNRVATDQSVVIILASWSVSALGLALTKPLMMVFGYTIKPWFIVVFFLVLFIAYIVKKRKKVL